MATLSNLLCHALVLHIVCFQISLCVDDCYSDAKRSICHSVPSIGDLKLPPDTESLFIIGKPSAPLTIRNLRRWEFKTLTQLTELTMIYAGVEDIAPDAFQDLKQLKRLELKFNKIERISQSTFKGLDNLENIDLTGNEGCIIEPGAVSNLPLRNLYLVDMKIRKLYVNSFDGLDNLRHLDLSGNRIKSFNKDILKPLHNLESLDITGNQFNGLDQSMESSLQKLKSVSLGNNPWQCNCGMKWFKNLPMKFIYDTSAFSADRVVVCNGPEKFQFKNFKDIPDTELTCKPPTIKDCLAVTEKQGDQAKIVCNISGDPFPADITWTLPDKTVINSLTLQSANEYVILDNGVLLINSLNFSQSGTWQIQVKNTAGADEDTVAIKVLPPNVAATITGCRDVTEKEGNKAVIECTIHGNPFPNITWNLPDKTTIQSFIGPDVSKYDILSNGSLVIKDLETLHDGQWDITVMNELGTHTAVVYIKVLSSAVAPTVKECHDVTEQEGKQALIECTIEGNPFPNITWTLPDKSRIQSKEALDKSKYEIKSTGVLLIKSLALSDAGVWRLSVQNKFGHDDSFVNIKINKVVETSTKKPESLSMGVIIGAGAGGGVAVIALIIIIAVCCKNKKNAVGDNSKDC